MLRPQLIDGVAHRVRALLVQLAVLGAELEVEHLQEREMEKLSDRLGTFEFSVDQVNFLCLTESFKHSCNIVKNIYTCTPYVHIIFAKNG